MEGWPKDSVVVQSSGLILAHLQYRWNSGEAGFDVNGELELLVRKKQAKSKNVLLPIRRCGPDLRSVLLAQKIKIKDQDSFLLQRCGYRIRSSHFKSSKNLPQLCSTLGFLLIPDVVKLTTKNWDHIYQEMWYLDLLQYEKVNLHPFWLSGL